jgi:hypothetical protein
MPAILDRLEDFFGLRLSPTALILMRKMTKDVGATVRTFSSPEVWIENLAELGDYIAFRAEGGVYAISLNVLEGTEQTGENTLIADHQAQAEDLIAVAYGKVLKG